MFYNIGAVKNFAKFTFTGKKTMLESLFNKVSDRKANNLIKK